MSGDFTKMPDEVAEAMAQTEPKTKCNICGDLYGEDDIHMHGVDQSAFDRMQARAEAAERECKEWALKSEMRDQADAAYLKRRESLLQKVTELEAKIEWCKSSPMQEKHDKLHTDIAGLRAALERIAHARCAWQLSQEIAKEALKTLEGAK